jgi:glycosyltransferase involved in cell wall biosynthesis
VNDEAYRGSLRASGIARAAEFTWERTARMTLEVYRRVA